MDRSVTYELKTFGCKVNTYDSGLLENRFAKKGFEASPKASVVVFNTCAVTGEATKEALREIRKLKSKSPDTKVVVTGCGAQVDSEKFSEGSAADLIVANSHKGQLEDLIQDLLQGKSTDRVYRSNIFRKDDLEAGGGVESGHSRAFLKIQDGCNSFCTYCVIPFARGKSRSISIPDLVERVKTLHLQGAQEVVLTGVHIGDYESTGTMEERWALEDLIEAILDFTEIPRIRLTSLEPGEVTERLLGLYDNPRLCRHFHMSIQSANTKVLSDMKRRYSAQDVETSLRRIEEKVPGAFVGMDVIVGFPGETEEEFLDTYQRLNTLPWTRLHVFPYSSRPGTKAALRTDHWDRSVILKRSMRLRELSMARLRECAERELGLVKKVLVLNKPSKGAQGLSRDYWPIAIEGLSEVIPGREIDLRVTGHRITPQGDPILTAQLSL